MELSNQFPWEVLLFLSIFLSKEHQTAYVSTICIYAAYHPLTIGYIEATIAIVGNAIGSNEINYAIHSFKVIFTLNVLYSTLLSCILYSFRFPIANLFSQQQQVTNIIIDCIPIIALVFITMQCSIIGLIIACGW